MICEGPGRLSCSIAHAGAVVDAFGNLVVLASATLLTQCKSKRQLSGQHESRSEVPRWSGDGYLLAAKGVAETCRFLV
jgi:hypothetical protein